MPLGDFLRQVRNEHQLSLRDVQRLAKDNNVGPELSSGYLSLLERGEVKEPSPRILSALAQIYGIDYIDLMRRAKYIPEDVRTNRSSQNRTVFRGAAQLDQEQRRRVQHMIDFELAESRRARRRQDADDEID